MPEASCGLFAYGSLLNLNSFELTLGKKHLGRRQTCIVQGWRRSWDTAMPNEGFYEERLDGPMVPERIMYMNVRRSPGSCVNGVVYSVTKEEVDAFDKREWTYDRITVDWTGGDPNSSFGQAYMYVAKPEWNLLPGRPRTWAAVRKTYIDIIAEGVASLGTAFGMKYEESTDFLPPELVFADKFPEIVDRSRPDLNGT